MMDHHDKPARTAGGSKVAHKDSTAHGRGGVEDPAALLQAALSFIGPPAPVCPARPGGWEKVHRWLRGH